MRRRGMTVVLGFALTVLLGYVIGRADVPYVALSPGPTVDTLGAVDRDGLPCKNPATPVAQPSGASPSPTAEPDCQEVIQITGTPTSTGKGQLRMVTVSVHSSMNLIEAIRGWLSGSVAVVPRRLIYPEDKTEQQVEQENKEEFQNSQTSAETAALTKLGYPMKVAISEVVADGASAGVLRSGDIIESVDGTPVTSAQKLQELVKAQPAGTARTVAYLRDGVAGSATITTKAGSDNVPRLGVGVKIVQPHPFQLRIKLDKIGGPSAGMMFALGIIDKIKSEDLTHGFVVAGTGTIDDVGNVGPIGGVTQKLYGAKEAGATIFLTPAANCEEAKGNVPDGLRLVKVSTLDEALAALDALPAGGPLPSC